MAFRDLEHFEVVAVTAHNAVIVHRSDGAGSATVMFQNEVNCILYPNNIGKQVTKNLVG